MATSPVAVGAPQSNVQATGASGNPDPMMNPAATKEEFISLLVAQLRNQDPLSPMDGAQFLSQLTEINSLEQLLGIRQDLDKLAGQPTTTASRE